MTPHGTPPERPRVDRQVITVPELAAKLEKRLYADDLSTDDVQDACLTAARQRLGGVITRPEHIRPAADVLRDSGVALGTALGWYGSDSEHPPVERVLAEAEEYVAHGATELGYVITRGRIERDDGHEAATTLAQLVQMLSPHGVKVRAVLAIEELTDVEVRRTCRQVGTTGACMVQGGLWRGKRAGLSEIEVIRDALPPEVLVKWTEPVKSLSTMLLCISMGVDRFNGDIDQLLADAARAEWLAPLTIPVEGFDY